MAENSENIEARLCAYVEGDLDEAGRVEIEKHLEAHPNHRRLLSELKATRDLLRFLPREQAPPELSEIFNAQLERSALLDGAGMEATAPSIRANFLPRVMAMAAIVLLTAGLGVVVYFGLLPGESGTRVAMPAGPLTQPTGDLASEAEPPPARTPDESRVDRVAKGGSGEISEKALARRESKNGERVVAGPSNVFEADPAADAFAANDPAGQADATSSRLFNARLQQNRAAGNAGADPVYVLVSADNLNEALREVTSNLAINSIEWEPAQEPAPDPVNLGQSQIAVTSAKPLVNSARVELENAMQKKRSYAYYQRQQQRSQGYSPPAVANQQTQDTASAEQEQSVAAAEPSTGENAKDAAPSEDQLESHDQKGVADTSLAAKQKQEAKLGTEAAEAEEVAGIRAYMTRQQLAELGRVLNRPSQQVEVIADDEQLQTVNTSLQQVRDGASAAETEVAEAGALTGTNGQAAAPAPPPAAAAAPAPAPTTAEPLDRSPQTPAPAAEVPPDAVAKAGRPRPSSRNLKAGQKPATARAREGAPDLSAESTESSPSQAGAGGSQTIARHGKGGTVPVIQRGTKLKVTVDELAGPDTDKTATAEVEVDGTIRLPKLDEPLRVEGLTRSQAETVVADAYTEAGVIDSATVSIEPIEPLSSAARMSKADRVQRRAPGAEAAVPATSPNAATTEDLDSGKQSLQKAASAEQPAAAATQQSVLAEEDHIAATTQHADIATTKPADEQLAVVILVQRSSAAADSESHPATQPATETPAANSSERASDAAPTESDEAEREVDSTDVVPTETAEEAK